MADVEVIHVYRHLLRSGLRAVQFAKPARFVLRDKLREGFREKDAVLDSWRISRTVMFLDAAARERGLEHQILKNLVRVSFERQRARLTWQQQLIKTHVAGTKEPDTIKPTAYKHYEMTISMLNDSMALCLR